ncbi:SWIM zinc finger family protein [Gracilimonas mengyeensis]|uniref:Uncharacterized conserved protein, contains Zn finger domain n=1 Tax=Gracilimonas mengyeensis TaxID=1302730 RepID=A0A521BTW2_9BACT|nr:SWIM zinc finger family protein [Gracilimonas mengyeensis]SMO50634.1 Uncharacterized conserved protein, contains Zn finger domain [Gracilimonas mengyeensis]
MNLKDFERNISSTILDSGYDYFVQNAVDGLEKVAPGMWLAKVHGSEIYTVEVNTHKTKIKGWECNCPYDHSPICKHVVALFYAIEERMNDAKTFPKNKKKSAKKNRVQEIFKKTSKEELQEFIIAQFGRDAGIKNAFMAHFVEYLDEDQQQKYKTIVRNIYKAAQGPYEFIDYYSAASLTSPLYKLAEKANDLLAGENIKESLAICKALIEEIPVFLNNMDDSDGSAGDLLYYAFETLGAIVQQAPPMLKDELFTYCTEEFPKQKYHGFGFESHFLHYLPELITTEEQEEQFFELIDRQVKIEQKESYSDYGITQLIKTKVEYLLNSRREDEAIKLIKSHKNYPDLRKMLVDRAIAQKEFKLAKTLCHEGVEAAKEKNHPGIVTNWQQKLLEISKIEEDTPEVRRWAEKLFFEHYYAMGYYRELKATYSQNEWPDKCEELISAIKNKNRQWIQGSSGILANIYAEEKHLDQLLKVLQQPPVQLSFIDSYASLLIKEYPNELLDIYEEAITNYATQTGRNIYNDIANYLKKMTQIEGGTEKVHQIIKGFRQRYSNRPAMMEVMNRNFPGTMPKSQKP